MDPVNVYRQYMLQWLGCYGVIVLVAIKGVNCSRLWGETEKVIMCRRGRLESEQRDCMSENNGSARVVAVTAAHCVVVV